MDDQQSKLSGVATQEPILQGVGGELEESETPGVAEPTGAVTLGEKPEEIIDATIDEPPVSPILPDPPPNVPT